MPQRPSVRTFALLLALVAIMAGCGALPPPTKPEELLPCVALRRHVCGVNDECKSPGPDATKCDSCKSRLCEYVRTLEDADEHGVCFFEWRSRPEYPACRAPQPLPTLPPPPFAVSTYCEAECSPIPYPPSPPHF